jgi:hypothetical protein
MPGLDYDSVTLNRPTKHIPNINPDRRSDMLRDNGEVTFGDG